MVHELIDGDVKVSLEYIGEGWDGDYDSDNPEDTRLLRLDVQVHKKLEDVYDHAEYYDEWNNINDASYCTGMPLDTPDDVIKKALRYLMDLCKPEIKQNYPIKRLCEKLSWMTPKTVQEAMKE